MLNTGTVTVIDYLDTINSSVRKNPFQYLGSYVCQFSARLCSSTTCVPSVLFDGVMEDKPSGGRIGWFSYTCHFIVGVTLVGDYKVLRRSIE